MSILLTSGKRNDKAKKPKKIKKYRIPQVPEEHRPPLSDANASVWFWDLNGQPTTVIFYKANNEVWCNGIRMEAFEGFAEGGAEDEEDETDFEPGAIIDFTIFVAETQTSYNARICRLPERFVQGYSTHRLTVDEWKIPEHVSYDYLTAGESFDAYEGEECGEYYEDGAQQSQYSGDYQ